MKHVLVKMFDAQEVPNGKEIKIARSYVSVVTTDGREHRLQSTGTKHFRDADYIPTKDWLQWAFGCVPKTIGPFARALGLQIVVNTRQSSSRTGHNHVNNVFDSICNQILFSDTMEPLIIDTLAIKGPVFSECVQDLDKIIRNIKER